MDSRLSNSPTDSVECCCCTLINPKWNRSLKRKFKWISDERDYSWKKLDDLSIAHVEIENECAALQEMLNSQQKTIQELYTELEEERNASASAANETMSMILRLQREKAEVQMEARQFKQFTEERMAHDQQELLALEDVLYKRDQDIQSLTCEVQAYKHRLMSFGCSETEVEVSTPNGHTCNQRAGESFEFQYDNPPYDYPPLKCNLNEMPITKDCGVGDDVESEKYAFRERPLAQEHLQNLEYRIYQLERNPSSNLMDGDFSSTRNFLEKAVIRQSPRQSRNGRKFSIDRSSSLSGLVKEANPNCTPETPRHGSNLKKMDDYSRMEDLSLPAVQRKVDNASDFGDDMSDRIYTVDSVQEVLYNGFNESKIFSCPNDDCGIPRESFTRIDIGETDIKKLYMRFQALEADRESMRQAIISMRTDKAQLIFLREIAQQLCKDMSSEKRMPVRKLSLIGRFLLMSVLKSVVSFFFGTKKAHRSKFTFGLSNNNVGLLMLLDRGPRMWQWRCLTRGQCCFLPPTT